MGRGGGLKVISPLDGGGQKVILTLIQGGGVQLYFKAYFANFRTPTPDNYCTVPYCITLPLDDHCIVSKTCIMFLFREDKTGSLGDTDMVLRTQLFKERISVRYGLFSICFHLDRFSVHSY